MDVSEVPETDILFECPHCGKSLSIDPRGAGLVIRCTSCGEPVTVPIPEGMSLEAFDATPEALSEQLLQARQKLTRAQERIAELEAELERRTRDQAAARGNLMDVEQRDASARLAARNALELQRAALEANRKLFALLGGDLDAE